MKEGRESTQTEVSTRELPQEDLVSGSETPRRRKSWKEERSGAGRSAVQYAPRFWGAVEVEGMRC